MADGAENSLPEGQQATTVQVEAGNAAAIPCDRGYEAWLENRNRWLELASKRREERAAANGDTTSRLAAEVSEVTQEPEQADSTAEGLGLDERERAEGVPSSRQKPQLPDAGASRQDRITEMEQLTEAERLNLRSCLASTVSPYPKLRRRFPLKLAIQVAVQLWNADGSPLSEQDSPVVRLAQAAREGTQDLMQKTAALGSSFVSWSQGLWGSATQALDGPCKALPSDKERKENALLQSLRSRGGVGRTAPYLGGACASPTSTAEVDVAEVASEPLSSRT
eukprot:TRINITY_DN96814_c0_g1_i1.p1 TRINITY_DN96814_c0_g1~~TRINITY_DN96814_c0_g1_i1.p1  ORF type:complete len:290 (+),score=63.74 TRINITY_DN96814_c0_g1_i1:33-872(+)